MEKQLARVVNMGLVGEPQNICLQVQESLKIVPFSTIKFISQNDEIRNVEINDGDFEHTEIKYIINHMGHIVSITWDEAEIVTMYF
jgi:hypothetical protein